VKKKEKEKQKKREQEEREKEAIKQNVQKHIANLIQQLHSDQPTQPSDEPSPISLTPQQIALASASPEALLKQTESIAESIIQSTKKLRSPKHRMVSRDEFFDQSCGFDKLAVYLSSHGVTGQTEDTVIPTVDGSRPTEAEGDNTGVDLCPYTVLETSPLSKVHFMFSVMGLSHVWVVREGRLEGLVTKEDLMNMEKE
jgi:hypothetical protein